MTSQDEHLEALHDLVSSELRTPVRPGVAWLAERIAERHGEAVAAVLFYGSCLRKQTHEGVLDFWVVVDDYASAHSQRGHALLNHIAPPSVYYLERDFEGETLRTKYGVIGRQSFDRATRRSAWHPYVWARFTQPTRLLACRDEEARRFFEDALTRAISTFVGTLFCQLPDQGGLLRFSLAAFWREAFRSTYDSERRPESEASIRTLYDADADRYDRVAQEAFLHLCASGEFDEFSVHPQALAITVSPGRLRTLRTRWRLMRAWSRTLGLARLLKTTFTFGDWVPYVLWKMERHTGEKIVLSERQRRHPLIFGWPIILPLLTQRSLRAPENQGDNER